MMRVWVLLFVVFSLGLNGCSGDSDGSSESSEASDQGRRWVSGSSSVAGPQGPQGVVGPIGPQGPAGPSGPAGPAGPQGVQGVGCSVSPLQPSGQYPTGGAQINCGANSTSTIVTNGSNAPQEWKLVASGQNHTEGARYTMNATGLQSTQLMSPFTNQHVSVTVFNWPLSTVTQMRFRVKNLTRDFCVGGNGVVKLASSDPTQVYAKCTRYDYSANQNAFPILSTSNYTMPNWTRLSINGSPRNNCTNPVQNSPNSGFPGMYGYADWWTVECLYSGGNTSGGDWQNTITNLVVEEADYSGGAGIWQWEIWAR